MNRLVLAALGALLAPAALAQAQSASTVVPLRAAPAARGGGGFPLALGGTGSDRVLAVVSDAAGNTYVTGDFTGTFDFDPGPGTVPATSAGGNDLFVASYDAAGAFR